MTGHYVHRIDPVLAEVAGLSLWWYGLGFALGLWQLRRWLEHDRQVLGLSRRSVWSLSIAVAIGVLAGGRGVEIAFDEWPFYRTHPRLIPAFWLSGMATHGLLLGGAIAAAGYGFVRGVSFLRLADSLAIPAAVLMGLGRIGNFIDGQIVGSVTDVPWAVIFPYADGPRHPVVLYDGAKNLLLACYLLHVRRTTTTPGAVAARFVFWYAFPRIFIDVYRDYATHRLALGTGQTLNLVMAALGAGLLARSRLRRLGRLRHAPRPASPIAEPEPAPTWRQRLAFACVLACCLTIPSNWTQNVPVRYGTRHAGLAHSWLYPAIDWAPPRPTAASRR